MKTGTTKVLQFGEYVSGWLDSSVHDFLDAFLPSSASAAFALITCLDSNTEPGSIVANHPELRAILNRATMTEGQVIVPTRVLRDSIIRDQLFVGFDEIWFFPSSNIEPKPKSTWIVGPSRIDQTKLDRLGRWMKNGNCSLALGDGDGLNFIVKARGTMKHLIALSMSQRQPALQSNRIIVQDEEKGVLQPTSSGVTGRL